MLDFKPPLDSPIIIGLARLFLPQILSYRMSNAEIKIVGNGLQGLHELDGKRTVICPNHSHRHDPEVMFALSCFAKQEFNFIAAREVFDWNQGLNGWFLQHMGCYSVVRGAVDRESFKTTKKLLVSGKKKLVLFPEGEISKQNDTLLPLESGVAQLSFMSLDELHKNEPNEAIYILPVALKYTYKNNLTPSLSRLMTTIENKLGLESNSETSLYSRVRKASEIVLKTLEEEYNCKMPEDAQLNDRINNLKSQVLQNMAEFLDITLPKNAKHLDMVRILRNTLDDFIYANDDNLPPYQKKIHEEKAEKIKSFYHDLSRVVSFIAIYEGYLSPPTTQERLVNVIELLEQEIFGHTKIKGPRLIYINIGEPINLLDYFAEYKRNKKQIIEQICEQISHQLLDMLEELDKNRIAVIVT